MNLRVISLLAFLAVSFALVVARVEPAGEASLATIAEKSNYTATSKHAEVIEFCEKLAKASPLVRLGDMGATNEGRRLPFMIIADPPVATAEEAAKSGKLVAFAMGNIHAGEVDGKEALLALARDLAIAKDKPLLKDLIVVLLPNFNPDGGDKFGNNRKDQAGPPLVGTRHNAQNFDLNRDFVKLESPECQALIRFCRQWDPALLIDCHTTNGSYHQYLMTYDSPRHPSNMAICEFGRDVMLPDVTRRLQTATGFKSFYYGNFERDKMAAKGAEPTRWASSPAEPRYGIHYQGFRNRIGILSESYDYAPYRDRVLGSYAFVKTCFEFIADNKDKVRKLLADADRANVEAPVAATVAIRHKTAALPAKATVLGIQDGKTLEGGGKSVEYKVDVIYKTETTLAVARPYAYLLPATHANVLENLQRHGIDVEELREDVQLDVQVSKVQKIAVDSRMQAGYGKHNLVSVDTANRNDTRMVKAGTIVVRTNQRLGTLAAFLLEPQSEDGLTAWNFFDAVLKEGQDFPVLRLLAKMPMLLGKVRPLADERGPKKLLTPKMLDDGTLPNLLGDPTSVTWTDDGEHFLQFKDGQLLKVEALTGRCEPAPYAEVVAQSDSLSASGPFAQQKGKKKGGVELRTESPDGKYAAFVRGNNLYIADNAAKTERALTKDGSDVILNGKADWVYWEEVYDRKNNNKHFWWSSDSKHLAFLRLDETKVPKATVIDYSEPKQTLELTPYPRAGDPNPVVKMAIAAAVGGEPRWVDLSDYAKVDGFIISRVGWLPDGKAAWFVIMDRSQTWLDFCTVSAGGEGEGEGGKPTKLLRDTTKAWVNYPLDPKWLEDGSFILSSERTGWQHLYHFAKDGKLLRQVTKGDWDVRSLQRIDAQAGYIYFTGTKENLVSSNAYKIKLDGTGLERVTKGKGEGNNDVQFSPKGSLFVNRYSDDDTPTRVSLHRTDGTLVRMLDTNPVYAREEVQMGGFSRVQIPTPDGFAMEATVQKPTTFDPAKKYPVWLKVYGGPSMPMIKGNAKGGGDQALANAGYIVMHVDPRSASGKGAVSAWTCYKQLGVQELADLETAVKWLTTNPWADSSRVGIEGHSYGGYMAAFALINSKMFAAGVSGAPPTDWRNYDSI